MEGIDLQRYLNIKKQVLNELKGHFRPEFLNRVDDIVVFKPLSKEEIKKIVVLQLEILNKRLRERDIMLTLSENAIDHIVTSAYDPLYGARPLKRFIQTHIETEIARAIIAGKIFDHSHVTVDYQDGSLKFENTVAH